MTKREEIELVLLRYRDGYYRRNTTSSSVTHEKSSTTEQDGAIDAIVELFEPTKER